MNDDLISRQAAIDAITNHQKAVLGEYNYDEGIAFGYAAAHRHIIDIVNVLPSEQKWIPVTERLPDFGIYVLLNEGYSYTVGYLIKTTAGKYEWGVNGWYNDLEDWSVWMPLPEPYKEKDDGEIH